MAQPDVGELKAAKVLSGPFHQFDGSVIFEYLEPPPSLHATVLIRGTFLNPELHPINKTGTKHPQSPPLHIHFDQWESFLVTRGKIGTISTWDAKSSVHTAGEPVHVIGPWVPHTFFPIADAEEDTVLYLWAHPEDVPDPMDRLFFQSLLGYLSDIHEKKVKMSLLQIMVNQHASATAMVMFPRAWWLGPLRWWIPWHFQGALAMVGRAFGYRGLIEANISSEEWQNYLHSKRA